MNYSILLFFCVLTVYFILKNKNPLVIEIVYFIISPCVKLGSLNIDSTYLFVLFVIIVLLIKKKGKFKAESFNGFFHLMVFWIIFYLLGWIINGQMINLSGVIISVLGLIKNILVLYVCALSCVIRSKKELDRIIGKSFSVSVLLNLIAVLLQMAFPAKMYDICYQLYYSASSTGYTNYDTIKTWGSGFFKGKYYRYFGLFDTPMNFSCFIIIVLTLVVVQLSSDKTFFKYPKIVSIVCFFLGLLAQCKIFFLMLPVLIVLYILFNFKRINFNRMIIFSIIIFGIIMIFLNLDSISGISTFRYLRYLKDPVEAFATRLGSDDKEGYIFKTLQVALQHPLFGVGPVSVAGETIADSSYIVLFHNGGIFSLVVLMLIYFRLIVETVKKNQVCLNILIISLLIMGMSRTILISGSLLLISIFYINKCLNCDSKENNSLQHERNNKV